MAEQTLDQQATQMPITIDKRAIAEGFLRDACIDSLLKIEGAVRGANAMLDAYYATGGSVASDLGAGWQKLEIVPAKYYLACKGGSGEIKWEAHIDEGEYEGYDLEVFHTDPAGNRIDTTFKARRLKSMAEAKSLAKYIIRERYGE